MAVPLQLDDWGMDWPALQVEEVPVLSMQYPKEALFLPGLDCESTKEELKKC